MLMKAEDEVGVFLIYMLFLALLNIFLSVPLAIAICLPLAYQPVQQEE